MNEADPLFPKDKRVTYISLVEVTNDVSWKAD